MSENKEKVYCRYRKVKITEFGSSQFWLFRIHSEECISGVSFVTQQLWHCLRSDTDTGVPSFEFWLCSWLWFPATTHLLRQQLMAQVLVYLSPTWEIWIGFLAPGFIPGFCRHRGENQQMWDFSVSLLLKVNKINKWKECIFYKIKAVFKNVRILLMHIFSS